MVTKIEYSPAAKEDLLHIKKQIEDKYSKKIAEEVIFKLINNVRRLEQFPLSGVSLGESIGVNVDYRYIFVEKNYIIYRIDSSIIKIIRVLSQLTLD
ncbi:type II toxin-antitoxin system RelE/ParE family toxin [Youngiibacter multivorans]|uniref:Addiction module RelE/StbE family toxin n=1 Tax=Youngiibacter multivorans TaxID=937251 RepID=A0ABS4G863_9CLOT|nr:type II toxin-antitoxin system RelE/ParE family toxin [Youngiibacter multivorans]MBP1920737.1 addiction module RelE/StbE family toxin [Youngiibacter multivorans]